MKATIHHGGAGTTAAALRAGKPTAISPLFGDQPFWAKRVARLEVAPPPLNRRSLSVEDLVATITAMEHLSMRSKAAAIGEAIDTEEGVDAAIEFIEQRAGAAGGRTALQNRSCAVE